MLEIRKKTIGNNQKLQLPNEPWPSNQIHRQLRVQASNYEYAIIDCGPADSQVMRSALAVCDLAIIPVSPSPVDIWSAKKAIAMIHQGNKDYGVDVTAHLLISRKITGTTIGKEVRDTIQTYGLPVFKTEISQRIAVCESLIIGKGVVEYQPNSSAAKEFKNLSKEVEKTCPKHH